ncbi:MAG: DUF2975 domain-containing protein [Chloroflexi bacterium]|nr:DUF2975 domain-containing protein [Chloroflexota bacterium]
MYRLASRLLRVVLIVLLLGSALAQVLLPVVGSHEATIFPEVAYLVFPYSVAGILAIACGQVALLALWRLLSLVDRGGTFGGAALRWLDVITVCAAVATVLSAGVAIHLIFFVGAAHPVTTLALAASLTGGLGFVLLMVIVRGVLESAIANRAEFHAAP